MKESNTNFLDINQLQTSAPATESNPSTPVNSSPNETEESEGFDFSELASYLKKERLRELKISSTNRSKIGKYIISMTPNKMKAKIRLRQELDQEIECDLNSGKATLNGHPIDQTTRVKLADIFDEINKETEKGWSKVETRN